MRLRGLACALPACALSVAVCFAQSAPGTVISNEALVRYTGSGGRPETAYSNRVDVTTTVPRTVADLVLTRIAPLGPSFTEPVGPAACLAAGVFTALPDPATIDGSVVDPDTPLALVESSVFHAGEAVFVRVVDADQNLDSTLREYASVTFVALTTGDTEQIRLTETAPDSGVFAGYVPTTVGVARPGDCLLQGERGSTLEARYVDPADAADMASAAAGLDPISRVFDALTGQPVDGARLTLVDVATGQAARLLADDGVSAFPATVTAGGTVADAAGNVYSFDAGEFRFPVVSPGRYQLLIEPPAGFLAPSGRAEAQLQALAGAPYSIGAGSFGGEFLAGPGPFIVVDVPIDPTAGTLFLDKRGSVAVAAPGDFVEYRLTLTHTGGLVAATDVVLDDFLPAGLKYLPGSARLPGTGSAISPSLSADGRTLSFAVDTLAPDDSVELSYVAAVVPGSRNDEIVNRAVAQTSIATSNEASASLRLIDDLFSGSAFIVGRVTLGTCRAPSTDGSVETDGVAGIRVYLEDGRFAVSDEGGRFHFEGVPPGAHVVQLDSDSLPPGFVLADCSGLIEFAGTSASRLVELRPGALRRADFALVREAPPSGRLSLELGQTAAAVGGRDVFEYRLALGTEDTISTADVQAMVMLPLGFALETGSVRNGAGAVVAPRVNGNVVTLDLGSREGPWHEALVFRAAADGSIEGELSTRALARFGFDGERVTTPAAETFAVITPGVSVEREYVLELTFDTLAATLSADDRAELDALVPDWRGIRDVRLDAVGHSDSVPITPQSRAVFADNYALSAARARAVVDYLSEALLLVPGQVGYRGVGPDFPRADNTTPAGRRANRRVELEITGVTRARERDVAVPLPVSPSETVSVEAEPAALPPMSHGVVERLAAASPGPTEPAIVADTLEPGVAWLWPQIGHSPAIPTTKVVIQHVPGTSVRLSLNGDDVSPLNFEGVERSTDRGVAVSRWRGLDLGDGPNVLRVRITDGENRVQTLERRVHFAGPPVRGRLLEERSTLVADGRTRPRIVLNLVDRWGEPAREGSVAEFAVEPPYRSWWEIERLRENPILMSSERTPTFTVGPNGNAAIELEPTTLTGEAGLTLRFGNAQRQELRTVLRPAPRDWILVGLAEGTLGHSELAGAIEQAQSAGFDDNYYEDGRLAFYAKGQVKGSLLTLAFDSDGKRRDLDAFGGVIDPDRYYSLYGDNTEQRFDAASRERLYVKVERDALLVMVGDFETGLTITELARYSRSLTGFHSESHGERVSHSAFAARAEQSFIKDELRGDGISGPYYLSRDDLLPGSDKLTIESRDRFRPDQITATRTLRRHFDYDIDYASGAIYFREPIPRRDFDFNPVYIVVDYETGGAGTDSGTLAGGRVGVAYGAGASEVGATVIEDGTRGAQGRLVGVDLRHRFSPNLELKAEIAATEASDVGGSGADGSAYLVEMLQQTGRRQIEAYWRETEAAFGLGQQRATEPGTRRGGVTMRNELSNTWLVETEMFRQRNLLDGATRTVLEGESRYQDPRRTASMGLRRVDEDVGSARNETDQAFVGGSWRFFEQLLTTRLNVETALSGGNSSFDYPTRTLIGADLAISPRMSLLGEHEIAEGDAFTTRMTRFGVKANPGARSQVDSVIEREMTEYGPRSFANLGMRQGFTLGERWTLDVGAEQSRALDAPAEAVLDERVPLASGSASGDFSAAFVGVAYRATDWSFTSRLEHRDADRDSQSALIGGFYRERRAGRGFSAELRVLDREVPAGHSFAGNLRLGWAYRPAGGRLTVLERADWIAERRSGGGLSNRNLRLVNNFNAYLALNENQTLALQYAVKSVRASFEALEARGLVDLFGVEWRRRIDARRDFGLHGSLYRAADLNVVERGWGIDVGMNIAKNLNIVVGYNFAGFEDGDFFRARYTAKGPFMQFRLKVDQASLAELLRR